jgi:hypothetical protein
MTDALIYVSRTPWNPLHPRRGLLEAAAAGRTVVVVEAATCDDAGPEVRVIRRDNDPIIVAQLAVADDGPRAIDAVRRDLIRLLLHDLGLERYVLWLDSPTDLTFTYELVPVATVYACTDNLAADADDPTLVLACEEELLREADVVLVDDVTWSELEHRIGIAARIRSAYAGGYDLSTPAIADSVAA